MTSSPAYCPPLSKTRQRDRSLRRAGSSEVFLCTWKRGEWLIGLEIPGEGGTSCNSCNCPLSPAVLPGLVCLVLFHGPLGLSLHPGLFHFPSLSFDFPTKAFKTIDGNHFSLHVGGTSLSSLPPWAAWPPPSSPAWLRPRLALLFPLVPPRS